jgi:uncharacterized CHY-type Zn-finger protein
MNNNRPRIFDLPIGVAIKCIEQDKYGCYGCDFNLDGAMFSRKCNAPEGLICGHYRNELVKYQEISVDIKTLHETSWGEK